MRKAGQVINRGHLGCTPRPSSVSSVRSLDQMITKSDGEIE
jgi:hypothetical protein